MYIVSQKKNKKQKHYTFVHNLAKCYPILFHNSFTNWFMSKSERKSSLSHHTLKFSYTTL